VDARRAANDPSKSASFQFYGSGGKRCDIVRFSSEKVGRQDKAPPSFGTSCRAGFAEALRRNNLDLCQM